MINGKEPDLTGCEADAIRIWDASKSGVARALGGAHWSAEVAYALTPGGECVELARGEHRDYSAAPPGSICGTLDANAFDGGVAHVIDWEASASAFGGYKDPVSRNLQLKFAAFVTAGSFGVSRAKMTIAKLRPHGVILESCELGSFELAEIGEQLDELRADASRNIDKPRPGWWCAGKFCPVAGQCPAVGEAMSEAAKSAGHIVPASDLTAKITSSSDAGGLFLRLKLAEQGVKQRKADLKTFADENGPFPTSAGKVYGKKMRTRKPSTRSIAGGEYAWFGEFKP